MLKGRRFQEPTFSEEIIKILVNWNIFMGVANQKSFCERLTDIPWKNPNYYSKNLDLYVRSYRLNKWPSCLQYNWLNKFHNKRLSSASSPFFYAIIVHSILTDTCFCQLECFRSTKWEKSVLVQLWTNCVWCISYGTCKVIDWYFPTLYLSPLLIYVPLQLFMLIHESPWYTSQISWSFKF